MPNNRTQNDFDKIDFLLGNSATEVALNCEEQGVFFALNSEKIQAPVQEIKQINQIDSMFGNTAEEISHWNNR